ncbi:hypothetical protein SARI_04517 [Salmonella enterica subsp. arizonae serovar 62:z4,z23:-]|uniref:Uncharacterized protein n=2 Tax=Salmonella enterica subsp. arizonae TaxID=59203 RepID=A9MQP7_SALAR|nr:hypothetical protein SARI_04517 [Salmonella enterica subsp. arizonae serovar 62:z4,z23:-]SUG31516.1 Uncharacterised protein [Salmonella enterica subsp. arizonae]
MPTRIGLVDGVAITVSVGVNPALAERAFIIRTGKTAQKGAVCAITVPEVRSAGQRILPLAVKTG